MRDDLGAHLLYGTGFRRRGRSEEKSNQRPFASTDSLGRGPRGVLHGSLRPHSVSWAGDSWSSSGQFSRSIESLGSSSACSSPGRRPAPKRRTGGLRQSLSLEPAKRPQRQVPGAKPSAAPPPGPPPANRGPRGSPPVCRPSSASRANPPGSAGGVPGEAPGAAGEEEFAASEVSPEMPRGALQEPGDNLEFSGELEF